jgi:hypothetical protein
VHTGHDVRLERDAGLQHLEEELRLRHQSLSLGERLLRRNGVHLDLGDRLVFGLVLELDLVVGVVARDAVGPAHRRTTLVVPRHLWKTLAVPHQDST